MKEPNEVKKSIVRIVITAAKGCLPIGKDDKEISDGRDFVKTINAEINKLKESGDLDSFVAGWQEILDPVTGKKIQFDVYFTRGDDLYHVDDLQLAYIFYSTK